MSLSEKSIALEINSLAKSFRLPSEKASGAKQALVNMAKGVRGYTQQQVLKDISFTVHKGDFFGIVGRNGSGKSTLLKLISGIYTSDSGTVTINGSLVAFIELGVGFNDELTGRENVYLNGALMGFSTVEIDGMYDEIVEFAELHDFMEQKLKNYSSGMQVRLAFSCAIRANSDILVLDEVLAVGDEAFQRKCNEYFMRMSRDANKTVILVTHSMADVRQHCNKTMLIKQGEIVAIGHPDQIADEYSIDNIKAISLAVDNKEGDADSPLLSAKIVSNPVLSNSEALIVEAKYKALSTQPVYIKFAVLSSTGLSLMTANSQVHSSIETRDMLVHTVKYTLPLTDFNYGDFSIVVLLADATEKINIADFGYNCELPFKVTNSDTSVGGLFKNQGNIELVS